DGRSSTSRTCRRRSARGSSTTTTCCRFATRRWPASSFPRVTEPLQERPPEHAVVRHVVVFGRVLREGGLEIGPRRIADALRGLDAIDLGRQEDVYWTLRQTLVSRREDLETFDRAFHAWFLRVATGAKLRPPGPPPPAVVRRRGGPPGQGLEVDGGEIELGAWSRDELLRT